MMDPNHYSPYHHPYYRVGATGVKDHHHHHHQSVESAAQAAAVQTRILEMRKEKSRDAARSRRGKENHEFYELAKMLPLPAAITSQLGNALLDKASIIRLTISYLKLRDFSSNGEPSWNMSNNSALKISKSCNVFESHQGTHILQSLDGFAFALGQDGRFLYISETVSIYLGLSQVEMTGSSVFDYTHQQDHAELAEQLGLNVSSSGSHPLSSSPLPPASVGSSASNESDAGTPYSNSHSHITTSGSNDTMERQFCIRMKSTLTKRGCQHFKSSGYRVVHIIAHLRPETNPQQRRDPSAPSKIIGMVAVAIALPPPSINELRLESDMFVTRLGLDFRIAHCEPRVSDLLNYTCEELTGRNLYSLIHGQDVIQIRKSHLDLIHKGQVMTNYYRIINKSGGYTWMQTCATLISNNTSSSSKSAANNNNNNNNNSSTSTSSTAGNASANEEQEQSIICVNYVLSAIEYNDVVMDSSQLNLGSVPNTPTPPIIALNKRNNSVKRSHSSTPSPESSHPNTQLSHSQTSAESHNTHGSHTGGHSSHGPSIPPPQPSGPQPVVSQANGSPGSPVDVNASESAKRRRFNSSPVRPWKSPSPPSVCQVGVAPEPTNSASNLLRHISVIRETPPILKPQVVAPTYHPHAHHYHHLVDPYAAAYHHLYKNGGPGGPMTAQPTPAVPSPAGHHHWGAYN